MNNQTEVFSFEAHKTPNYKPINAIQKDVAPKIISAMMIVPYFYAQGCVKGLEKYTQQQIKEMYDIILHNPPQDYANPEIIQTPFNSEEDIILLSYIKKDPKLAFEDFMLKYGFVFNPNRTKTSIQNRISQLKSFSSEETDKIYENFSRTIVKEERFYESITQTSPQLIKGAPSIPKKEQCYCLDNPILQHIKTIVNPNIDEEMNAIQKPALGLISKQFEANDLAIFVNERVKFSMKNIFLTFGRQSGNDVEINDIDLSYFNSMVCTHVSRTQAMIQFMHDGNFYCKNIGEGSFRIDGDILLPNQIVKLSDNCIFDFCDTIFIFFINKELVQKILRGMKDDKDD